MSLEPGKLYFCIAGNTRLAFEGARGKVESFVSARLAHHAVAHEFCTDWSALEGRVRELLRTPPPGVDYIVVADVMNPFTDMTLVAGMTEVLARTNAPFCGCDGAVPGTEVRAVLSVAALRAEPFTLGMLDSGVGAKVRWETQTEHNNQLNLYKYKRLKLFLALNEMFDDLHRLSAPELLSRLSRDDAFALLAAFGDELRQISYASCPHCDGRLNPLVNTMSQPFCGYLPSSRPLYHECEFCGLVVQSPSVHEDDVHTIYDKWDKQDFVASTNNPYTSDSIRCDFAKILPHLPGSTRSLDLGGGVGNFSRFLHETYPGWNVTHSDFEIKASASEGVRSRTLDFTQSYRRCAVRPDHGLGGDRACAISQTLLCPAEHLAGSGPRRLLRLQYAGFRFAGVQEFRFLRSVPSIPLPCVRRALATQLLCRLRCVRNLRCQALLGFPRRRPQLVRIR
jgi:hypothetical protein